MTLLRYFCSLVVIIFVLNLQNSIAQSLVGSSGSTINGNGYNIEYTVGVISATTISSAGNTHYITSGVLQPNPKVANHSGEIIDDTFQFFPNPTSDKIRIVGRYDWIRHFMIFSPEGKLLAQSSFENNFIDLTRFAAGLYIIRLFPGSNGTYKTLKIVKKN